MGSGALDTRFAWYKPEAKPGSKGKGGYNRRWGFEWYTRKGALQLRWTSEKEGGDVIRYQPHPGLFRIFAGLRDRVEILVFANVHGDILGVPGREYYQLDGARLAGSASAAPMPHSAFGNFR